MFSRMKEMELGYVVLLVLLVLLIRYPVPMLALGAVLGAGGWLAYHIWVQVPREREEAQSALERRAIAAVVVQVRYDRDSCPDRKFPLRTVVHNGSDRTMARIDWTLRVAEPGHSADLLFGAGSYATDRILQPGWTYTDCFGLASPVGKRRDAAKLEYTAEVGSVGWR